MSVLRTLDGRIVSPVAGGGVIRAVAESDPVAPPSGDVAPFGIIFAGDQIAVDADAGAALCLLSSPGAIPPATWTLVGSGDADLLVIDGGAVKLRAAQARLEGETYEFTARAMNSAGYVDKTHTVTVVARVGLPDGAVLFERELIGAGAPGGTVHTFGQPFARGRVPHDGQVHARIKGGGELATQFDPQTWWEDGSVKYAVGAIELPSLAVDATEDLEFVVGGNSSPGASLDWATLLSGRELQISVQTIDGGDEPTGAPFVFDVLSAASNASRFRRNGALVLETRVETAIPGASFDGSTSGRIIVDLWLTADGSMHCVPVVGNDCVDWPEPTSTPARVQMTVTMDGADVDVRKGLIIPLSRHVQHQYGRQGGAPALQYPCWLRIPVEETMRAGFGGRFMTGLGSDPAVLTTVRNNMASPAWDRWTTWGDNKTTIRDVPHANPGGGAWFLYGPPFTDRGAAFIVGGHPDFFRYEIGAAEALGISQFYVFDRAHGRWLNDYDRPGFRAHSSNSSFVPGISVGGGALTRTADGAHRSMASILPTLYTGRRDLLDTVISCAHWDSCNAYRLIEGTTRRRWFDTTDSQVRTQAYTLSLFNCALFCTPVDDPDCAPGWLAESLELNLSYWVDAFPAWNEGLGELHGAFPHSPGSAWRYAPWMQSIVNMSLTDLATQGNASAAAVLSYSMHFPNTGFLAAGPVWPINLTSQFIAWHQPDGSDVTTWAQYISLSYERRPDPGSYDQNYVQMYRASLIRLAELYPEDGAIQAWLAGFWAETDARWVDAFSPAKIRGDGPKNAVLLPPGYPLSDPTWGA